MTIAWNSVPTYTDNETIKISSILNIIIFWDMGHRCDTSTCPYSLYTPVSANILGHRLKEKQTKLLKGSSI